MTIAEFIQKHGITASCERTTPDAERAKGWPADASHWLVTLRFDGREMQVPFSQGSAIKEPPTAEDVLDCLASDATGVDGYTFEEWADNYGYDTDSRKAEKTYWACIEQLVALKNLLGCEPDRVSEAYEELINKVERL